jgi:hypothetical protein
MPYKELIQMIFELRTERQSEIVQYRVEWRALGLKMLTTLPAV